MPATFTGEKKLAQRLAISCLARGGSIAEASERAQVHASTISAWKRDPIFRAQVDAEQERIAQFEPEAVAILRGALYAKTSDPWDWPSRLRAAKELLDQVPNESQSTQGAVVELVMDDGFLQRFEAMRRARDEEAHARYLQWQDNRLAEFEKGEKS